MQGTSTKLTASGFALAVTGLLFYALFEATWGPLFDAPPPEVSIWLSAVISSLVGWLVPEKAGIAVSVK